ncbi:MAG: hypothetical protein ACLRWQ_14335 [Flavonifractor plautii]
MAVNAIMGSLLKHGYVDELANSILISVEDDDAARGAALEQKLTTEIGQVLDSAKVNGAILSQTLSGDSALQQKADEYGISLGKATLIQSLVDSSNHLTFESLVGLSINRAESAGQFHCSPDPGQRGGTDQHDRLQPGAELGRYSQPERLYRCGGRQGGCPDPCGCDQWGRGVPGG